MILHIVFNVQILIGLICPLVIVLMVIITMVMKLFVKNVKSHASYVKMKISVNHVLIKKIDNHFFIIVSA